MPGKGKKERPQLQQHSSSPTVGESHSPYRLEIQFGKLTGIVVTTDWGGREKWRQKFNMGPQNTERRNSVFSIAQ
jgi:hypothetical protein